MTERERIELCEALDRCDGQVYDYVRELEAEREQLRLALQDARFHATMRRKATCVKTHYPAKAALERALQESQQRVKKLETENTRLKSVWTRSVVDIVKENNEQQTVIQELAEALESLFEHADIRCQPMILNQARGALSSASTWMRNEGEK